jgi:hypothetical protein
MTTDLELNSLEHFPEDLSMLLVINGENYDK